MREAMSPVQVNGCVPGNTGGASVAATAGSAAAAEFNAKKVSAAKQPTIQKIPVTARDTPHRMIHLQ